MPYLPPWKGQWEAIIMGAKVSMNRDLRIKSSVKQIVKLQWID